MIEKKAIYKQIKAEYRASLQKIFCKYENINNKTKKDMKNNFKIIMEGYWNRINKTKAIYDYISKNSIVEFYINN